MYRTLSKQFWIHLVGCPRLVVALQGCEYNLTQYIASDPLVFLIFFDTILRLNM